MSKIFYESYAPRAATKLIIARADEICEDYADQGYDLTLRQLFYQFVSKGWIANSQKEYTKLGKTITRARLAGMIDWDHIVDRTRSAHLYAAWDSPAQRVRAAADGYSEDLWADQPYRVEVWVEKEALAGVIDKASARTRVPWFSCKGYTSSSSIWGAAQRLRGYIQQGQIPVILHLGDHDPSGVDMTRDIEHRLGQFILQDWYNNDMVEKSVKATDVLMDMVEHIEAQHDEVGRTSPSDLPLIVNRIALNMDQIVASVPPLPPNPLKKKAGDSGEEHSDSRAEKYVERFGTEESWELDALEPRVLDDLIVEGIEDYLDRPLYEVKIKHEKRGEKRIKAKADELAEEERAEKAAERRRTLRRMAGLAAEEEE